MAEVSPEVLFNSSGELTLILTHSCPEFWNEPSSTLHFQVVLMNTPVENVHDLLCLCGAGEGWTSPLSLHRFPSEPGLSGMQEEIKGVILDAGAVSESGHGKRT